MSGYMHGTCVCIGCKGVSIDPGIRIGIRVSSLCVHLNMTLSVRRSIALSDANMASCGGTIAFSTAQDICMYVCAYISVLWHKYHRPLDIYIGPRHDIISLYTNAIVLYTTSTSSMQTPRLQTTSPPPIQTWIRLHEIYAKTPKRRVFVPAWPTSTVGSMQLEHK